MSKKVSCNSCGNNFIQDSTAMAACPVCGSNSIVDAKKQATGPVWKETGVIISFAILLLMIIALFFLPTMPRSMNVELVQSPEKCLFSVVVKQGTHTVSSNAFEYSCDEGKTWQPKNEFYKDNPGKFNIMIRPSDKKKTKFKYLFTNPFTFIPACKKSDDNPCNCDELAITSIDSYKVSGLSRIVIHTNQESCTKQYSITGAKGTYKNDSVFVLGNEDKLMIFIKTEGCDPIAYSGNPYELKKNPTVPATPGQPSVSLTQPLRNVIAQNNKDKILNFIEVYFADDPSVPVIVNGSTEMQIYDYLMDRSMRNYNKDLVITVTKRTPSSGKIKSISVTEQ